MKRNVELYIKDILKYMERAEVEKKAAKTKRIAARKILVIFSFRCFNAVF